MNTVVFLTFIAFLAGAVAYIYTLLYKEMLSLQNAQNFSDNLRQYIDAEVSTEGFSKLLKQQVAQDQENQQKITRLEHIRSRILIYLTVSGAIFLITLALHVIF